MCLCVEPIRANRVRVKVPALLTLFVCADGGADGEREMEGRRGPEVE